MHRSASTSRVPDEIYLNSSLQMKGSQGLMISETDLLPTYNPLSEAYKKEQSRIKSAENAVHLIPFVIILCAIILWVFSHPADVVNRGDSVVARVEGLTIDGYNNQKSSKLAMETEPIDRLEETAGFGTERPKKKSRSF